MLKFVVVLVLLSTIVDAQTEIPRDTSFTPYNAFIKERKKYPFIEIAYAKSPKGISRKVNIAYTSIGERKLLADVVYPKKRAPQGYPAVVMIFGGGWKSGDKSHNIPMAEQLAIKGFVAVTIEYRLSLEAPYPAAVFDVKAAVRWLRANAAKFNVDANRIAILGMSAGGQLAALVAATNGIHKFEGVQGHLKKSSAVQAFVDIDGILAFKHPESEEGKVASEWLGGSYEQKPAVWLEASALTHVSRNTPPGLFINSSNPRFHAGRDDMIEVLNKFNIYSEVHTFPNSPHPFWLFHPWFLPTVDIIASFLNRIFRKQGVAK